MRQLSKLIVILAWGLATAACGPDSGTIGSGQGGDGGTGGPDAFGTGNGGADARQGPGEFVDAAICNQTTPIVATGMHTTPDMLIVLDRSGSMDQMLSGGGGTKMDVMKSALMTIVPATEASIHWGLEPFASDNSCGAGIVTVPIAPMNGTAVSGAVTALNAGGSTPTPDALTSALTYYNGIAKNPDGRYVLLATDGQPNCDPSNPFGGDTSPQAIAAVTALANAGIKTFVIGFGDVTVSNPTTLMSMAVAGGTGMYYAANSPAQLMSALNAITGGVAMASCTYSLATTPPDVTRLTVTVDGTTIPRDPSHGTGWDYDAATNSITFYGTECSTIKTGMAHNVGVDYGCMGPVIP